MKTPRVHVHIANIDVHVYGVDCDPLVTPEELAHAIRRVTRHVSALATIRDGLAAIAGPPSLQPPGAAPMPPTGKFTDLTDALDRVNVVTNEIATNVDVVVSNEAAQIAEIQALKDQIAAGGAPVTVQQLEAVIGTAQARATALQTVSDTLKSIAVNAAEPIPPVPPIGVDPNT